MRLKFWTALCITLLSTGSWLAPTSHAALSVQSASATRAVSTLTIHGTIVHVEAGNFWGVLGSDGKPYDPGTLPEAFQKPDLLVVVEAKLVRKRPARMWGKAIEIVRIETTSAEPAAHHQHQHNEVALRYQRSVHEYHVPDVAVVDASGAALTSTSVFDTDKTLVVSFIFTSCTAICPILTSTLTQTRQRLGPDAAHVRIVSISIDPDYDTAARLRDYAQRFNAQGDWRFLTGEQSAIRTLQRAFEADRGDKNSHQPLALIRHAGQQQWVRLDGFTSADELAHEIQFQSGT